MMHAFLAWKASHWEEIGLAVLDCIHLDSHSDLVRLDTGCPMLFHNTLIMTLSCTTDKSFTNNLAIIPRRIKSPVARGPIPHFRRIAPPFRSDRP